MLRLLKGDQNVILQSGPLVLEPPAESISQPDPAEKHDLKRVIEVVEAEEFYLEPNLTISTLAKKVQMPEHKLRQLVNQHMGYRNFADFLNEYRIEAAKIRLADVANRRQQVLVLAMDLGYGSLGPFNRAFKARTGLTPSEYRKKALAETE
ncbi:MAG: AraC family transcriptional regulator [Kordiimonadaceae bacterium]|nr:AraC family transcriptional regulator [Kordiimonadaceae bacterium]